MLDRLRRLQQFGQAGEAGVVEEHAEGFQADLSLTDVLVPVDTRAERLLRVVEVEGTDVIEADEALDLSRQPLVAVTGPDVVAGGKDVAGVDADADALAVVEAVEDRSELFDRAAEA